MVFRFDHTTTSVCYERWILCTCFILGRPRFKEGKQNLERSNVQTIAISIDLFSNGTFQIEFESFHEAATNLPLDISSNDTQAIYLGPGMSTVEVKSKVPNSGRYSILVKFFQPNHAKFDVLYKIDADKLSYDGKLNIRNCPSISGCRELILQTNEAKSFELEENVTITFTVSN